ncbi:penicillin acylase family protein [Xanthovirga aplysinae]|uniref:penicillin acylase family protein n=1 Tax=Xanthovirga aplysinae TaxID=2529853 RepID=UPI00165695B4|nr:penicillin acylase family protein [Xanthovirga aplysinae]
MKIFYRILAVFLALFFLSVGMLYFFLQQSKPKYEGQLSLQGLTDKTEVIFDSLGIPHIYASNEKDAYFTLGYVHAQERLFQMEMLRRLSSGRLAEILGNDLVEVDRFFRTLGLQEVSDKLAKENLSISGEAWQQAALAYLEGVNQFIKNGSTPPEFRLLNIPKEEFTPEDMYLITGYMAFSFALAIKTDPVVEKIYQQLGPAYLKDWALDYTEGTEKIPVQREEEEKLLVGLSKTINQISTLFPVAPWVGSNGWIIAPEKSKSGKVLLANDTHIGFAQPSVWYEAHLEAPGFSLYGNHLAGAPFAVVGHNRFAAWGLTMLENDDMDFFQERRNPDNPRQVWVEDHWEEMQSRREVIKVKGEEDVVFEVFSSRHGPVVNAAIKEVEALGSEPVSLYWTYTHSPGKLFQAMYKMGHAQHMDEAREAAEMIHAPGLNIMYGDQDGNIAWWGVGRLLKRPTHVQSKRFLDGASGMDEYLGFYDFKDNPKNENPQVGFIITANNQPDTTAGILYPGYYVPEDRARRIRELLNSSAQWSLEELKKVNLDDFNHSHAKTSSVIYSALQNHPVIYRSENHKKAARLLKQWKGEHQLDQLAPTVYYKLLSNILKNTLYDELGKESYETIYSTHLMKRTIPILFSNDSSLWWDNTNTPDQKESREEIFAQSFEETIMELEGKRGKQIKNWQWGEIHTLEHVHPIGRLKPFDKLFNVGPFPAVGGDESINNLGFNFREENGFKVIYGPAMRILIDFDDVENSLSVLPTGQSGHFLSPHYDDQVDMFNQGQFRKQMMNREEIHSLQKGTLVLQPESTGEKNENN